MVWSENASAPTEADDPEWFSDKKPVLYDRFPTTSLNNRFIPPAGLRTDAVFAVDDDIRVPCQDLDFAYEVRVWWWAAAVVVGTWERERGADASTLLPHTNQQVWKVADDSLVGFMPRIHTLNPAALAAASSKAAASASASSGGSSSSNLRGAATATAEGAGLGDNDEGRIIEEGQDGGTELDEEGSGSAARQPPAAQEGEGDAAAPKVPLFLYNGWWKVWWEGEYSLVLTKAAFLHRDFLRVYTEEMPAQIRWVLSFVCVSCCVCGPVHCGSSCVWVHTLLRPPN